MEYQDEDAPMTDDYEVLSTVTGQAVNGASASVDEAIDGASDLEGDFLIKDVNIGNPLQRRLLPTGCCYDPRMKLHANPDFGDSKDKDAHPEDPARIEYIMAAFKETGLVYKGSDIELVRVLDQNPNKYMCRIPARKATKKELLLLHTLPHYAQIEGFSRLSTSELRQKNREFTSEDSLYVGSMSFEAALIAVGGAIEACKAVVTDKCKNAFAVIRPPGHHAEFDKPMGFCLFNNVSVAALVCQEDFQETCRKILILDWDVHHGNGVQNAFYSNPNVLYISLHVWKDGTFYPGNQAETGKPDGRADNCGNGPGVGKNVNIPWHDNGMGDAEYMAAFQKIVMPISLEFNPDLVIISAGFDAAAGDQLGCCNVTPACYAHMTHMLMSLANGRVAVCLEGGYNLDAISISAVAVAETLMGMPPPKLPGAPVMYGVPPINREAALVLETVKAVQAQYWECMRPGVVDAEDLQPFFLGGPPMRVHDVIRRAQRQSLADNHNMRPLYIQREVLFKSYENQVLATPLACHQNKVLVIMHDTPELFAQPDPVDRRVDAHNAFAADGVVKYIDWAVKQGFGVIDVNVPCYVTRPQDTAHLAPKLDNQGRDKELTELLCYIWDNYLQLAEQVEDIVLLGSGEAYLGVKVLLVNRDCKDRISAIVNFVDGPIRPVKSDTDTELSRWYAGSSLVFVSKAHACWLNEKLYNKIKKRRYGNIYKSEYNTIARMMGEHYQQGTDWILKRVGHHKTTDETMG